MATKEKGRKLALDIIISDEEDFTSYHETFCLAYFSINMLEYITNLVPVFPRQSYYEEGDGTWEIDADAAKDLIAIAKEDLTDETKEITISALEKVIAHYRRKTRNGFVVYTNELL